MKAMFERPDNSVSEFEPKFFTNLIDVNIEWKNLSICRNVIANLPAEAAVIGKSADTFGQCGLLLLKIMFEGDALLIFLADVVRGGCNYEPCSAVREFG